MASGNKKTLTKAQIRDAKRMLKEGKTQKQAAKKLRVSQGTISVAVRGEGAYKKAA